MQHLEVAQLARGCLSGRPGKYLEQSHTQQRLLSLLTVFYLLFVIFSQLLFLFFTDPGLNTRGTPMFMLVKGESSAGHKSTEFSTSAEVRNLFAIVLLFCQIWTLCYACIC